MLIVKTGTARTALADPDGDFEDWIARGLGRRVQVCSVYEGDEPPTARATGGVVVTGSAAMVSDHEAWADRTAEWLRTAVDAGVPVLGICFGHQLLAHALGGKVGPNPRGREIGTIKSPWPMAPRPTPFSPGCPPGSTSTPHIWRASSSFPRAQSCSPRHRWIRTTPSGAGPPGLGRPVPPRVLRRDHPRLHRGQATGHAGGRTDPDRLLAEVRETRWGGDILARFAQLADG